MRAKASKWKPALLVLGFFLFAHSAHAESIKAIHQPPEKVDENVAVELTVSLTSKTRVKEMRLRYRFPGEKRYHKIKGYQKNKKWWLVLPASEIKPPFVEYFIVGQSYKGRSHLVFASPQNPHRLLIGLQPTSFQSPSEGALQQIDSKSLQPSIPIPSKNKTEEETRREDLPLENNDTDKKPPQAYPQTPSPSPSQIISDEPVVDAGGLFSSFFQGEDKSELGAGYTQEASKAPGYASKMGRERIQALGARDLMDIIKSFPEMDTALSVSGFDLLSVRGIQNDARILLVVDGQPLSNPYDGRNYWNLSANQIEQVEILRGAAGALYGAGAVSAVVLVTTRRHTGLNLFVEGGSFNTFKGGLSAGKTKGNHSGAVNANIEYTSGPSLPIASDALSEANVERSDEDMLTHASGLSGGITGAYDYDIGQGKKTTLSARFQMFGEQRGPYIGYFDTVGPESNLNWLLWSGQGILKHRFSPNTELSWKIYGGQNVVDRLLQLAPQGFSTPDRDGDGNAEVFADGVFAQTSYDTINWGTEGRFDLRPSKEHHVMTGVRFNVGALPENKFRLRFNRDLNGVAQGLDTVENLDMPQNELCRIYGEQVSMGLSACRLTLAAFVQEDWRPTDSFAATLGLRFSSLSDLDFDLASHLTPRLALVWEPVSRWTIKTSAATAFRAPTLEEKYDQIA